MRRVLTSNWILVHLGCFLLAALFLRLGWWQWDRSRSASGGAQNFLYAIEWPVFAVAGLVMWWRTVRDEVADERRGAAGDLDPAAGEVADRAAAGVRAAQEERRLSLGPAGDRAVANRDAAERMISYDEAQDPEVAAYNRWLTSLAAGDDLEQGRIEPETVATTGGPADRWAGRDR